MSPSPPSSASTTPKIQALALILPLFRRYWLRVFFGIVALLGVDLCQLLIPRVIKLSIDGLKSGAILPHGLFRYGLMIVGLALGVALFRYFWRNLILGFSRLLERDIREQLFSHLLMLDRTFFQKRTIGELMALSSNDLASVQLAAGMGLIAAIDAIIMTVAVLMFMIYINPTLTLIALSPLPLLALLTKILSGRLHKRFSLVQETFSNITEMARSTINAMRLVKIYSREEEQTANFDRLGRQYIKHAMRVAIIQGLLFPVSGLVANGSLLLIVIVGGKMAIDNLITIGDFIAFISYLFMLVWPMMAIGWVANLFQRGLTSLSRIQAVLSEQSLLHDDGCSATLPASINSIELRALNFSYSGQQGQGLHDISLTLTPGLFGLVGPTGSGKSTLCHLLARLYPVTEGSILINGVDLNRIAIKDYRQAVAYAPQEAFLFADTIAANIGFGRPDATLKEIEAQAEAVGIHDEIMHFKGGYTSKIGEKGVMLSGGQRQRISLARAMLTRAPILIVDDGLSAVDAGTEQQIMRAILEYSQTNIVIMTSHRLAPLAQAAQLAVLEDGRLTALGQHHELLAKNDYYRAIYQKQTEPGGGEADAA
ncbi:MAG: ABC transporter ATP-binding protein [Desulfobulbaceae bacterium]|nr:ABC transporter ATP-binding protein [Desulfobulbaceae bacterium]